MKLFFNKDKNKNVLIHAIAILIFIAISAIYTNLFFVENFSNNIEKQNYQGTSVDNRLWDENSFAGSPQISNGQISGNNIFGITYNLFSSTGILIPFCIIFINLLGVYILQNALKITPKCAIIGSVAYGLFCYSITTLNAGNIAESFGISMLPYAIAGIVLLFNEQKAIGFIMSLIAIAFQSATGHYQTLYYTIFCAIIYIVFAIIAKAKEKQTKSVITPIALAITALAIGALTNSENIIQQQEFEQYASASSPNCQTETTTADDKGESLSLIIPNIKGGKSNNFLSTKSETYKLLEPLFGNQNAEKIASKSPTYFGKNFFSNGPSYIGALAFFLFVFGCIYSTNKNKWWLISITIIAFILSLGNIEYFITKNLPLFYNYCNYSNILIISAIGISILASMGIDEIVSSEKQDEEKKNLIAIYISAGITSIILIVFIIFPSIAGTYNPDENNCTEIEIANGLASYMPTDAIYANAVEQFKNDYIEAIRNDRMSAIRHDGIVSLAFVIMGAAAVFVMTRKKTNSSAIIATLAVLVVCDSTLVNKKYISDNEQTPINEATFADNEINKDNSNYRVLNIGYDAILKDNETYKNHKSIGGNGICTKRYETLCDSLVNKELSLTRYNILSWAQRDGMSSEEIQTVFSEKYKTPLLDMLNIKYIILSGRTKPLVNSHALGNVWFADSIKWADSEGAELAQMKHIDTRYTAIISEKYKSDFTNVEFVQDSTDKIELISDDGDILKYKSVCKGARLAIFSETFYPKGWKVDVDGVKSPYFRANYALRAMIVPAGEHEITFCFSPKSAKTGNIVSLICNILLFASLIISILVYFIYKRRKRIIEGKV